MDIEALTQMQITDLQSMLAEKKAELQQLRFKTSQAQLKDIRKVRTAKAAIAKILTVLSQKK
jgi:ribosomal protein L29